MTQRIRLTCCLVLLAASTGCRQNKPEARTTTTPSQVQVVSTSAALSSPSEQSSPTSFRPSGPIQFTDVTAQAGISFKHNSGAFGKKYLPETMGSGACFIDYDNDGWQDILIV